MKPHRPEYDLITYQAQQLRAIDGGDDWYTDIREAVSLVPPAEPGPGLQVFLATSTTGGTGFLAANVAITWAATVPIEDDDSMVAYDLLADMRAALLSNCPGGTVEASSTVSAREAGSNYAVVTVVTTTPLITEGRAECETC